MRSLALIILLCCAAMGMAQAPVLNLTVVTRDDASGEKLVGATVEVVKDGEFFASSDSDSLGKVPVIKLPVNYNYSIYIKKEGYVTKMATVDASYSNPSDLAAFIPFPMEVSLPVKNPCYDYSFLSIEPMINFTIHKDGYQKWDQSYTKSMLKKIADVKSDCIEASRLLVQTDQSKDPNFAEYTRLFEKGEMYEKQGDYRTALDYYRRARGYRETDLVNKKIIEVRKLRDEKENQ